ncbi:MAG: hypothetical protein ACO323_05860 [Candidatus Kapaibacteriota bacterium]
MKTTLFALCISLLVISCGLTDHNHDQDNDHDYATTIIMNLINENNSADTVSALWKDLDGPGGAMPSIIDTIKLKANTSYLGTIQLFNESKNPRTNITTEIAGNSYKHQFFFTPSTVISNNIEWKITDKDRNNHPVGLTYKVQTSTSTSQIGSVNIVLSHYDSMTKDGIRKSLESDIDIDFPVMIIN